MASSDDACALAEKCNFKARKIGIDDEYDRKVWIIFALDNIKATIMNKLFY